MTPEVVLEIADEVGIALDMIERTDRANAAALRAIRKLSIQLRQARLERDAARANARILAHAYHHDSRPPVRVVAESIAYPANTSPAEGVRKS